MSDTAALAKQVRWTRTELAWAVSDAAKPRPITDEVVRRLARFEAAVREHERARLTAALETT